VPFFHPINLLNRHYDYFISGCLAWWHLSLVLCQDFVKTPKARIMLMGHKVKYRGQVIKIS